MKRVAIILFRNDLRVHDNVCLRLALQQSQVSHFLPLYCFDPRQVDVTWLQQSSTERSEQPTATPMTYVGSWPKASALRLK
jgi:deoxyribodipyrimidine photo-lyase